MDYHSFFFGMRARGKSVLTRMSFWTAFSFASKWTKSSVGQDHPRMRPTRFQRCYESPSNCQWSRPCDPVVPCSTLVLFRESMEENAAQTTSSPEELWTLGNMERESHTQCSSEGLEHGRVHRNSVTKSVEFPLNRSDSWVCVGEPITSLYEPYLPSNSL